MEWIGRMSYVSANELVPRAEHHRQDEKQVELSTSSRTLVHVHRLYDILRVQVLGYQVPGTRATVLVLYNCGV